MSEVVDSIRKVSDIVAEIASASGEQSTGIEQVNRAIADMDSSTQHNAALVEESAAAATALSEQADKLAEVVSLFHLDAQALSAPRTALKAPQAAPKPAPARPLVAAPVRKSTVKPVPAKAAQKAPATTDEWETF
jgi:methyl-accepting chemotaxis protein